MTYRPELFPCTRARIVGLAPSFQMRHDVVGNGEEHTTHAELEREHDGVFEAPATDLVPSGKRADSPVGRSGSEYGTLGK